MPLVPPREESVQDTALPLLFAQLRQLLDIIADEDRPLSKRAYARVALKNCATTLRMTLERAEAEKSERGVAHDERLLSTGMLAIALLRNIVSMHGRNAGWKEFESAFARAELLLDEHAKAAPSLSVVNFPEGCDARRFLSDKVDDTERRDTVVVTEGAVETPPGDPYLVMQLRTTAKSFRDDGDHGTACAMEEAAERIEALTANKEYAHSVAQQIGPWSRADMTELRDALTACHTSAFLAGESITDREAGRDRQFIYRTCIEAKQFVAEVLDATQAPVEGACVPDATLIADSAALELIRSSTIEGPEWRDPMGENLQPELAYALARGLVEQRADGLLRFTDLALERGAAYAAAVMKAEAMETTP